MKHVKLFESFKEPLYEQIKPLPPSASCNVEDDNQLNEIINVLEQKDYENEDGRGQFVKSTHVHSIAWSTKETGWFAYGNIQHTNAYCLYETDIDEKDGKLHDNLIFFHEYFKLKHKFRGHRMKKFGV